MKSTRGGLGKLLQRLPKKEYTRKERAKRNAIYLSVATFAAVCLIPLGRPAGYALADGVCSGSACASVLSDLPQCTGVGRDKAISTSLDSFVRRIGNQEHYNVLGRVDGRITATFNTNERDIELYEFSTASQAKDWVLDRSLGSAKVINSSVGPVHSGAYDGYLTLLGGVGLLPTELRKPAATGKRFTARDGAVRGILLQNESSGGTTQRTVTALADTGTPALERLAARLGIAEHLVVTIRKSRDGSPASMTLAGPATQGWNLGVLRTTPMSQDPSSAEVAHHNGELTWRSYTLDLTRSTNQTAYGALVETAEAEGVVVDLMQVGQFDQRVAAGELEFNPYERLRDRVRDDAVFSETVFQTGESDSVTELIDVMALYEDHELDTVAASNVSSADLTLAGSQLAPFVSCEPVQDDSGQGA